MVAFLAGAIGGLIPNDKSNIHPLLMGAIFAWLATKILVGDYDRGYQWTVSDLGFLTVTALEGSLGAAVTASLAS